MKAKLFLLCLLWLYKSTSAQMPIRDEAILHQQERMVFKSWDRDKFTPKSGFLGLNPMYWITWGLHPNYPDTDLRPLGPFGPQTMRFGLVAAMSAATDAHQVHSDTLARSAAIDYANHSGLLSDLDPLWNIYYRSALAPLQSSSESLPTDLAQNQANYLQSTGMLSWYNQQHSSLSERLKLARNADLDRGSRIILYHRLMLELRTLQARWEDKKLHAKRYLTLKKNRQDIRQREKGISKKPSSDIEIANKILRNSKL